MRSSYQILLLVLLASLFRSSTGMKNVSKQNDIISGVKDMLVRTEDKLKNTTLTTKHNTSQTSNPLILKGDIISQLISLFNCGLFPISSNSHLQYSLDYDTNNLRVFQECNRYFKTTKKPESLQVQCQDNKWIFNKIICEETSCPRLTAPHGGHISTNENIYNTTVYFWCSSGFTMNGTDELLCQESGLWNFPPPTCESSSCRPLSSPRHGSVSNRGEIATNQTVVFMCESSYSLIGDAVLRCQDDGRWNTTAPVCKKMCTIPNITSQSEGVRLVPELTYLSIGSELKQGQRVIFSCKPGHTALSSGSSTCMRGKWRPPIRCRKACTAVEIANGRSVLSKDSSTVEYFCLPGYQLVGQQKLSCTSKLAWDSEPPICTKMCTLAKQDEVLSFRHKTTYEHIPFGTQIANGTQVNFVCRSKTALQISVTTCLNQTLLPPPCFARLVNDYLELYYNGEWRRICSTSVDVCTLLGYSPYYIRSRRGETQIEYKRCERCYDFDTRKFSDSSKIVLDYDRYEKRCMSCTPTAN